MQLLRARKREIGAIKYLNKIFLYSSSVINRVIPQSYKKKCDAAE